MLSVNADRLGVLLVFVIIALVMPFAANNEMAVELITVALFYAVVSTNWNLLYGVANIWSFGQLAFLAIGAYSSGFVSYDLGLSPWLGLLVGLGISVPAGLLLSMIGLRLKAVYFALATFGFAEFLRGVLVAVHPQNIFDIPPLQVGGFSLASFKGLPYGYAFLLLLGLSLLVQKKIMSSRIGLETIALRESEQRAVSLGVVPVRVRTILFLISVVFTTLAGSLYAYYTTAVAQTILQYDTFMAFILIMALGGLGTLYGPLVASFFWIFADFPLRLYLGSLRLIIMGVVVIATLMYSKKGLSGVLEKIVFSVKKWIGPPPD